MNRSDINDLNHDRVCLNCRHWQVNAQLYVAADGVICMITKEHTRPADTCSMFSANMTPDVQDSNRWHDKSDKRDVYKGF